MNTTRTLRAVLLVGLLLVLAACTSTGFEAQPEFAPQAGGDFANTDFAAAAPFTYNHMTGGGAYNDRTVGDFNDVTEQLEGGEFTCGDTVTYLAQITMEAATVDPVQTAEFDFRFLANSTGQSGAALVDILNVAINYGQVENGDDGTGSNPGAGFFGLDSGINDDGGSTATLLAESLTGPLFQSGSELLGTVEVDDLEPGETVVLRIDVLLGCQANSSPTGNLQAQLDGGRVTVGTTGTINTGQQTIPFLKVGDLFGAGEPILQIFKTVTTETGTCGVDDVEELTVTAGDTVKYCYEVFNPGTTELFDVEVIDDNGTPGNIADDFTVTLNGLADLDGESDLGDLASTGTATGEFLVTLTVGETTVVNTAYASGNNGRSGGNYAELEDSDDATVIVEAPDVEAPQPRVVKGAVEGDDTIATFDEPGGSVTIYVVVYNDAATPAGDATLISLTDDIYGDITTTGHDGITATTCAIGGVIPGGGSYGCSFDVDVDSAPGTITDTVTAILSNDADTASDDDQANVVITDLLPDVTIVKTADPTSVPEPGADVEFTIVVTNNSLEDTTIDSLVDSDFELAVTCADAVGTVLASGETYTCVFTEFIAGNVGEDHQNTATVIASDDDGNSDTESDDAIVTISDVPSAIEILKTANPTTVSEPGGNVTFNFVVNNLSTADSVTIDSLIDTVYGDLTTVAGSTCSVPQTIAASGSYTCAITVFVAGNAGDTHTNVATAAGTDDDGNPVSDDDDETVIIDDVPSSILTTKTANPTSVPETGGDVTFTIVVENTSLVDTVTITSVNDSVYGDVSSSCAPALPADLLPGETVTCTFTEFLSGDAGQVHTNVSTASGQDDDGNPVEDDDEEDVPFEDVLPDITILKTADPTSVPETGGDVTFTFLVTNNSLEDATLDSLVDSAFGDLNGQGDCSVPQALAGYGGTYTCAITVFLSGDASGPAHENVVTAIASDDDGNTDEDMDDETVPFDDVLPDVTIVKTADPTSVPEPGADVEFTIVVTNNSLEDTTIDSLVDSDFELAVTCADAVGTVLASGETYTCVFTEFIAGNVGEDHQNTATVIASDDDGNSDTESDDETVTIDNVDPAVSIIKDGPASIDEGGDTATYDITITNDSVSTDPLTITSLNDDQFGDLLTEAETANAGTIVLASGESFTFQITRSLEFNVGDLHTNVVTVVGVDDEGSEATDNDDHTVAFDNVAPAISVDKTADQLQVFAPGEDVTFTVVIDNDSVSTDPVTIDSLTDSIHGDLNGQGDCSVPQTIQPGSSYTCSFTVLVDGDETDVITASGTDDEGTPVSGSDDATVDMINPSVAIEKSTNGFDADTVPGPEVLVGSTVNWDYDVTNNGDVALENVSVIDDQGLTVSCSQDTLAVGESITCTASGTSEADQYANLGTANASHTDVDGDTANRSDSDPSHYFGATPSVDIGKTFADDSVIAGGAASSFTLVVANDGNVDLDNVSVFDEVDGRLTVTGISATAGADDDSDADAQTVEWLIANLGVGETVTITVDFFANASVPEVLGLPNTATVSDTYNDDSGNSTDIGDENSDTIDILVDINLSIVKTFDPTSVPQGTAQSFTIEVSNAGPSDAVNVSVTDSVHSSLEVTGVSVTTGVGTCTENPDQEIDCTVDIPAEDSVTITVDYTAAPFQTGPPQFGTTDGSEFHFVFVDGSILEGSADGEVFLTDPDGIVTQLADGDTKNDYLFDPPGSDPAFLIHLSCSDPFTDGWGQTAGPVEGVDGNWQIAFFSITRYKQGSFFRNCGNVVNEFDVPNIADATGTDSFGTQTVSDDATVTITPGITLDRLQTTGKRITARLTNYTGEAKQLLDVMIVWPSSNGNLTKIRLDNPTVWSGSIAPPSTMLDATDSGWSGGTLFQDEAILRFDFQNKSAGMGYTIRVTFSDGTFLDINQ